MSALRVLGIDPGSRVTGYGVVEYKNASFTYLNSGCIRTPKTALCGRLGVIYQSVFTLIGEYEPDQVAVEEVFMARNPQSALKLGQARGAAISAVAMQDLEITEYAARTVKKAITGTGSASKDQIQHMVKMILGLTGTLAEDAADALAIAICHVNTQGTSRARVQNSRHIG
ncbi:MAG: crossover junction endodeoxyribonuclease RuvC [Pseudomonadales bacterium]|nr:crossover junction endodeoxyribonuclease RuvC [Pseudomonadales bacterium]